MKKHTLFIVIFLTKMTGFSQEIQWAFRLLHYSSQRLEEEYWAKNILGDPMHDNGKKSWQPKSCKKEEHIKVGFLTPQLAKQVIISGVFDPSSLLSVSVFEAGGKEYILPCAIQGDRYVEYRQLNFQILEENIYVIAVKVKIRPMVTTSVSLHGIGITSATSLPVSPVHEAHYIHPEATLYKVENTVNSTFVEFGPLLSPDGKTLFFSRKNDEKNVGGSKDEEDIWFADWDENEGHWNEAKNFGCPFNNEGPNFINSISPDGKVLLLGNSYKANGKPDGGVSISYKTENGWSFPKRLFIEDERNSNPKANFFLSNDHKLLLMSVERSGETQGDRDIYVSFLQKDSTWTKPKNLGISINTIGTEAAPFLSDDGITLFYSSNGLKGYGGSDIYMAKRLDESWTKWSEPENLGHLVNTPQDESFFTISPTSNQIYFTSGAHDRLDMDIYKLNLPTMATH